VGRPKKPTILKLANGSLRHNPSRRNPGEPAPTRGIGPAPERLTAEQREAWDEVVGICYPGVLGDSDRIILEMIACLLTEFRANPVEFNGARITALVSMLGRLGLSPADRAKVSAPTLKKQNPFADL